MSTVLNTNGETLELPVPASPDFRFHIVTAQWNPDVTLALRDGALETLRKAGIKDENISLHYVPGTVELVNAAGLIQRSCRSDGIIIIGCVIRGDTPHFDYVCQHVAQGAAIINAEGRTPVIFGVLTVDNLQQALDRAGGRLGNKGSEAACAVIEMANLHQEITGR